MKLRQTFFWFVLASCLAAAVVLHNRHKNRPAHGPALVLPHFKPEAVTGVDVDIKGQSSIHAQRTNSAWQLTTPLRYPAQTASVEGLLDALARLTPAAVIAERDLTNRFEADEVFGFADPQATLLIKEGDVATRIRLGRKTAPGDQVFLQVVGREGIFVVDTALLQFIPEKAADWRDTDIVTFKPSALDRVAVTNNGKPFVLQRDPATRLWRMTWPLQGARADNARIEDSLQKLQELRVLQFLSDDPKANLEAFGLAPSEMDMGLSQGTNCIMLLHFGNTSTNDPTQIHARREGKPTIFTVNRELLTPWRGAANTFRDPHLVTLHDPVDAIEVHARDTFSVEATNGGWRIQPQGYPADAGRVKELLATLSGMPITQFVKDVVTAPALRDYGLDAPDKRFILKSAVTNASGLASNTVLADLSFGLSTNHPGVILARRADESAVYAVSTNDYRMLPFLGWHLRDRRFWNLSDDDVIGATIRRDGRMRQLLRSGSHQWSLAPGSQGVINDLAVEESVRGLLMASAVNWVACGEEHRAEFGFVENGWQITIELKNGVKASVEFGGEAPSGLPLAAVQLDGKVWICEFPLPLFRDLLSYLSVP